MDSDPSLDFTCPVDSLESVRRLEAAARRARPFQVLLDVGVPRGRAGARDAESALAVARAVKAAERLRLRGVECVEGIVVSPDPAADQARVEAWLDEVGAIARRCAAKDLFEANEVLLSAGGSAYFDLVAARHSAVQLGRPARVLLRSGCVPSTTRATTQGSSRGRRVGCPRRFDRRAGSGPPSRSGAAW